MTLGGNKQGKADTPTMSPLLTRASTLHPPIEHSDNPPREPPAIRNLSEIKLEALQLPCEHICGRAR